MRNFKIIILLSSLSVAVYAMDSRERFRLIQEENDHQERPNAKLVGLASAVICCGNILKNWCLPMISESISTRSALLNTSIYPVTCAICVGFGICCIKCCCSNQCRKAARDCQKLLSFCCGEEIGE